MYSRAVVHIEHQSSTGESGPITLHFTFTNAAGSRGCFRQLLESIAKGKKGTTNQSEPRHKKKPQECRFAVEPEKSTGQQKYTGSQDNSAHGICPVPLLLLSM